MISKTNLLEKFSIKEDDKKFLIYSFLLTLVVHAYNFLNYLPNWDSPTFMFTRLSTNAEYGRFLYGLSNILLSSSYELTWVNGIVSTCFLSLAIFIIFKIFSFNTKIQNYLLSALIITSPAITATFRYAFSAGAYMFAFFLAIFALYIVINFEQKWMTLIASFFFCISLAIYQIYILVAGAVFALYLAKLLYKNEPYKKIISLVLKCLVVVAIGAVLYFIGTKVALKIFNIAQLSDYQGISNAGHMSIKNILTGFNKIIKETITYFGFWNLSKYSLLNALIAGFIAFFCIKHIFCTKNLTLGKKLFVFACIIAVIVITFFYFLVSADVTYHNLLTIGMSFIYVVPFFVWSTKKTIAKYAYMVLLGILCFYNFSNANIAYHQAQISYEKTRFYLTSIHQKLDEVNTINTNKLLIVGYFDMEYEYVNENPQIISASTNTFIRHPFHFLSFSKMYYGRDYKLCSEQEAIAIAQTDEFKNLNAFPHGKYVALINDVLVVKLPSSTLSYN